MKEKKYAMVVKLYRYSSVCKSFFYLFQWTIATKFNDKKEMCTK